jgi:hypothetical protein
MNSLDRRQFLTAAATGLGAALPLPAADDQTSRKVAELSLAPFRFNVTPPDDHSLCGGWIKPVVGVDDPLQAVGFVLSGAGKPIVLCAVDWTGLLNEAHVEWRTALAEAAGTTPERVTVHCVHQHNAPFACLEAERIVGAQGDLPHIVEMDFFRTCLDKARQAVAAGLEQARRVTHVAAGQARVEKVASNRRVSRGPDGKVLAMRGSACTDAKLTALPEGLIDPWLKTVAFFDRDKKVAACHYYATHPMSYYGDGRVSSDFAGLARKQRQRDEPGCLHLYFTGCAGNVAAGKYNDGTRPTRQVLTRRVYEGIVASEKDVRPEPVGEIAWRTHDLLPPPRAGVTAGQLEGQVNNKKNQVVYRNRPAFQLAWLRRLARKTPIVLSALHINDVTLLHLPAECFVEYQLRAQQLQGKRFVATAAYGDGGPWYIPTREEYPHGGYEVSVAFSDPGVDDGLTQGMKALLGT